MKVKGKWVKPVVIVVIVAAVCGGAYYGYKVISKPKTKSNITYVPTKATTGNMEVTVAGTGTVTSSVTQDVLALNNGTLGTLNVKEGDTVKAGAVIGTITDPSSQADLQKAQATLTQQNLALSKLQKSLATLYVKAPVAGKVTAVNIASGDDLSTVGSALNSASNAENNTKTSTTQNTSRTGYIVITDSAKNNYYISSPNSGIVDTVYVSVGTSVNKGDSVFKMNGDDINNSISNQNLQIQQAQSDIVSKQQAIKNDTITASVGGTIAAVNYAQGQQVQSGKAVVTIIDQTKMQTIVAVDELDITKVKVGQKANITLDALPNSKFTGSVQKIATLGVTTNGVTTYNVTLSIDNPTGIKVGMSTNASIVVSSKENVVMLPIEAVQGTGNFKYVYTSIPKTITSSKRSGTRQGNSGQRGNTGSRQSGNTNSGQFSGMSSRMSASGRKTVQTGLTNEQYVEIVSGVNDGDTVYIPVVSSTGSSTSNSTNSTRSMFQGAGGFGGGGYGGYGRGGN